MESNNEDTPIQHNLTPKQKLFCDYYVIDLNASKSAKLAGYSENSAYEIGHQNLKKVEIRAYIDAILSQRVLSAEETVKLTSDIAKSSVNDYMKIVQSERRRRVKKPLQQKIDELRWDISKRKEIADRVGYDEKRMDKLFESISHIEEEIIGYEIELERNPEAYVIELSDPELVESIELDLVKLAKDKEYGRIKTLSWGEFGPKVELYAADMALTNMLKIHGKFERDNRQKIDPLSPDERAAKLKELEEKILLSRKDK